MFVLQENILFNEVNSPEALMSSVCQVKFSLLCLYGSFNTASIITTMCDSCLPFSFCGSEVPVKPIKPRFVNTLITLVLEAFYWWSMIFGLPGQRCQCSLSE